MPAIQPTDPGSSLIIGLAGRTNPRSKFQVGVGTNVQLRLPEGFSSDHVTLASKDTEILQRILNERPKEIEQIMSAVAGGDLEKAKRIGSSIGVAEEHFTQNGGGMWALIILCVACALLLAHD